MLLGEAKRYGTWNLVGISVAVIIAVSGIFVLGAKKNYIANAEKKKKEGEDGSDEENDNKLEENLDGTLDTIVSGFDKHTLKLLKVLSKHALSIEEEKKLEA